VECKTAGAKYPKQQAKQEHTFQRDFSKMNNTDVLSHASNSTSRATEVALETGGCSISWPSIPLNAACSLASAISRLVKRMSIFWQTQCSSGD